jgi:hypothetical protein
MFVIVRAMKALAGGLLLWVVGIVPLAGQERDRSLERISLALQGPDPAIRGIDPVEPVSPTKLGIFTLVPPELPGEFVRVSVPVGELVSRAFRAVATAKRRRQDDAARRRVEAALKWFAAQPPSSRP